VENFFYVKTSKECGKLTTLCYIHFLRRNVSDIFEDFTPNTLPVAAASLGQVYRLKLKNEDRWVAVKVQRPGKNLFVVNMKN